ncbi:hypothetical protein RB593_005218 [Gaeumannomyces tritici]
MSFLGVALPKKFPTPVLKPLAPFFAAGLVIAYGINSAQNAMMKGTLRTPKSWKQRQSADSTLQATSGRTTPGTRARSTRHGYEDDMALSSTQPGPCGAGAPCDRLEFGATVP